MEADHDGGRQLQRVLWAIGEARRRRLSRSAADGARPGAADAGPAIPAAAAGLTPWTADGAYLDLSVAVRGGQALVSVVGELHADTAPRFLAQVHALAEAGACSVVVDLGGAAVDDRGLNALVTASALIEDLKGEMILKAPRSDTLRLLDLAGLSNSFVIF